MQEYEVLEGFDAAAMVCVELTNGILERGVTVMSSTTDITAIGRYLICCHCNRAPKLIVQSLLCFTAGSDYSPLVNSPLYFEAGSPLNSVRCVNITVIDDDIVEPDQTFDVSLSTMDPVYLTPISNAIVVIATDNDSKPKTVKI